MNGTKGTRLNVSEIHGGQNNADDGDFMMQVKAERFSDVEFVVEDMQTGEQISSELKQADKWGEMRLSFVFMWLSMGLLR